MKALIKDRAFISILAFTLGVVFSVTVVPAVFAEYTITSPMMTVTDSEGVPVPGISQSTTNEKAIYKTQNLPDGLYLIKRPDIRVSVFGNSEPEVTEPPVVVVPEPETPIEPDVPVDPAPNAASLDDCMTYFETNSGWCKIGSDNLANHTLSKDELGEIWGWSGPASITSAWNGAAVDVDGLKMYFHGLGHTDYMGTEVYEADLKTGQFKRLTNPPALTHQLLYNGGKYVALPDPSKFPSGTHDYDGALFVPKTGTILYVNSGSTSGYPVSSSEVMDDRILVDRSELGGIFEFNPSETETRNSLPPLGWRKVSSRKLSYPTSVMLGDQILLGTTKTAYKATLNESGLEVEDNYSYYSNASGTGSMTTFNGHLARVNSYGYLAQWVGDETLKHTQKVPLDGTSLACNNELCLTWGGGKDLAVFKDGTWKLKTLASGPENGASRVYSKFQYFPKLDIFMGVSSNYQSVWAYKYADGNEVETSIKSAQSYIDNDEQVPAGIYVSGVYIKLDHAGVYDFEGVELLGGTDSKGKIVTNSGPTTIKNAVLTDRYPHGGAAAIRAQYTPDLTIINATIRHQENGVLTGNDGGIVRIIDSTIEDNHTDGQYGQSHNIYIGESDEFQLIDSFIGGYRNGGHSVKSRALINIIKGTDVDQGDSNPSRIFDFPRGGRIEISDGTFRQSPNSDNVDLMAVAVEKGRVENSTVKLTNTHWIAMRKNARFLTTKENVTFIDGGGNTFVGVESPFSGEL